VRGYRAASYSITERSRWTLDILAEAGFEYDSSIFPVRHDRYGIPDALELPHRLQTPKGHSLIEFPLSTASILSYRLPVAGGGYFRLYPYALTKAGLAQVNRRERPFIFYLHPWEIDPEQPRISASWLSTFRHYNNLDKCEARLCNLMTDFRFGTTWDVLHSLGLTDGMVDQDRNKSSSQSQFRVMNLEASGLSRWIERLLRKVSDDKRSNPIAYRQR
jgi:polysaccharide deacetylase family protein (PEP-CTERM system associated)